MPSPRPPMTGSVRVVKPKGTLINNSLNAIEQTRVNITKSGALARGAGKLIQKDNELKNAAKRTTPNVVSVRSGSGISGKSGSNVGKVFKPMGGGGLGGLLGSIKNR